jgi:hypothetical protein
MDRMDRDDVIIALCREYGDEADEQALVTGWLTNHHGCCSEQISLAAAGDAAALIRIRTCMGLPIVR